MYVCAKCNNEGHDAHHIIARADKRHRWHPLNGVFLCHECHADAHQKPKLFKKWVRRKQPHVYKHTRNPNKTGFDPRDREHIKETLFSARCLLIKNAQDMIPKTKRGFTYEGSLPLIIVVFIVASIYVFIMSLYK